MKNYIKTIQKLKDKEDFYIDHHKLLTKIKYYQFFG